MSLRGLVLTLTVRREAQSSPEGLCRAEPERGPIVFALHFIGVGRGTGGFKFWAGNPPFWKVENVLSPGGTLQCRARKGSNCFYFRFYPPEGLCRAEPERSPIVFTLHFIGVGRGTGDFNLNERFRQINTTLWKFIAGLSIEWFFLFFICKLF